MLTWKTYLVREAENLEAALQVMQSQRYTLHSIVPASTRFNDNSQHFVPCLIIVSFRLDQGENI